MSKIGLVDVDGHNFPNFALLRISAYHKNLGDQVEWADPLFGGGYGICVIEFENEDNQSLERQDQ